MRHPTIIRRYLIVLGLHLAYLLEQIWGYSLFINIMDGMGMFLAINWVLYIAPIAILYFIFQRQIWAFQLGSVYTIVLILVGLLHVTGFLVTRQYFYGFAGVISGLGMIIAGIPLFLALRREIPALPR